MAGKRSSPPPNPPLERLPLLAAVFISAAALLCGCPGPGSGADGGAEGPGKTARAILERVMPEAMADGAVKIALLINERNVGNVRQFIDAAVSEGRSLGFVVDYFVMDAEADGERFAALAGDIARADYDGLVFANGGMGFSYDILRPAADAGVRIVTFEALPFRDGRSIPGLVTTFQDDYSLARLSLETMIRHAGGPSARPPRVFRLAGEPGTISLDRHEWEFWEFARRGRVLETALARLPDDGRAAAWEAVTEALPFLPPGSIDARWAPSKEFAIGAMEALDEAGRRDVALFGTGISNEILRLMRRHRGTWISGVAIDHRLAGATTVRILAATLAGEPIDDTFLFSPRLVLAEDLNYAVNVENISLMLPGWDGDEGLFEGFGWMAELKAAVGRLPRERRAASLGIGREAP